MYYQIGYRYHSTIYSKLVHFHNRTPTFLIIPTVYTLVLLLYYPNSKANFVETATRCQYTAGLLFFFLNLQIDESKDIKRNVDT